MNILKNKYFSLRIDIDSLIGLEKGVPNILKVLRKYNFKASFYITFGREGNLFEILKYKFLRNDNHSTTNQNFKKSRLKRISERKLEVLKMLFWPKKIVSEKGILTKIRKEGHDVGLHSYVHVKWHDINEKEIEKEFKQMIACYRGVFGKDPNSFVSPYFNHNKLILDYIDELNIKYASCLDGEYPFVPKGYNHIEVPVNTKMTSLNFPLIEYFARLGYDDDKILEESINVIEKNMEKLGLVTIYIHPRIEGYYFINIFEKLMTHVSRKGYEVKTYEEVGNIFCSNEI